MNNIYYNPEKFGLKEFGQLDLSTGYDFDKFVVWTMDAEMPDGRAVKALFWASDSGCSCPIPFEGVTLDDLSNGTPQACMRALREWYAGHSEYTKDQNAYVALLERLITL